MSVEERTMSRSALYEIVWSKPLKAVAAHLQVKVDFLVWASGRHQVPRPPSGYWAMAKYGKAPPRTPLPACDKAELEMIELPTPPAELDADILALLAQAKEMTFPVEREPHDLHSIVKATRRALDGAMPNKHHLVSSTALGQTRVLNLLVAAESIPRALCFLDALVRGVEAIGGQVRSTKEDSSSGPEVRIARECAGHIGIQERCSPVKPDKRKYSELDLMFMGKWDYVPNGRLVVTHGSGLSSPWCEDSEGGTRMIADQLPVLIARLIRSAGHRRINRREEPKRRRIWEEQERLRREKAEAIEQQQLKREQQRLERVRRQREERERVETFLSEARAWREVRDLRDYIAAMRDSMIRKYGAIEPGSEQEKWLMWAQEQADRRDPLRPSPDSVLDESVP